MCFVASLSRASYYRHWDKSAPLELDTFVRNRIQQLALEDRHQGYRRIARALKNEGIAVNCKRVLRLMRADNLLALRRRAFVPATTESRHSWPVRPNLVRGMQTTGLHQLWVADITYIRLKEEFVYLAIVLDAHSRRVVGWALEGNLTAVMPVAALKMAIAARKPPPGLIHHSDRGVQYACSDYTEILLKHEIQISMSRPGNPYDNAKAESFMATLKREQINGEEFRNIGDLRRKIFRFLEQVYNKSRMHSALGYLSPVQFENGLA
jgi:putative transposase